MAVAKIHDLPSKSIDFVLAFPQTDLELTFYMEFPIGFPPTDGDACHKFVICLKKYLYGLNQASFN